ncbi:MAG: hypothetical protein MK085_04395 [Phycisphaerales bacterium]|nr:hypothetical protein [Phycisphaerales bacterium]
MKSLGFLPVAALAMITAGATTVVADIPADLQVSGGSVATIRLTITVTGEGGDSETQSDQVTVGLGGGGSVLLRPDEGPFNGVDLLDLQLNPGDASLNYDFFCTPIACVSLSVNLNSIQATLAQPTGASIIGTGRADFFAPWRLQAGYTIDSILFSTSGAIDLTESVNFGTTWITGDGNILVNELSLGAIPGSLSGDLPGGIQVSLLTEVELSGASLVGNYTPPKPPSCVNEGACNTPHGNPGCDDSLCCQAVCEIDPACCESGWDLSCANQAVTTCGLVPENDSCGNPRAVGLGRHAFTTVNANTDGLPLISDCLESGAASGFVHDVWFTHVPKASNGVLVSTCSLVDFDSQLAVYDGCGGSLIACSNNATDCPLGHSRLGFYGEAGQTYLIRVGSTSGWGEGQIDIAWGDVFPHPTSIAVTWDESEGGNGHAYALYAIDAYVNYEGAMAIAEEFGGYLATLTSPQEQAFVERHMPVSLLGGPTAFGLYQEGDVEPDQGWRWVTEEPLDWTNWRQGEPNEAFGGLEDYGVIYPDGSWNDGLDFFGNILIEFDADPNLNQLTWSADDGGEGQVYEAVIMPTRVSWEEARQYAESKGGSLVSLETEAEADWVYDHMVSFVPMWSMTDLNGGPWLGLYQDGPDWRWLSGALFDWDGWAPSEPNGTGDRGSWYGSTVFYDEYDEDYDGKPTGTLFGSAQYADVFGNNRLKLVSDSQPGTWGTWAGPPLDIEVTGFTASFRFSFKNQDGGPGDGFSFFWGDVSDTSDDRMVGGEWGLNAFNLDEAGLTIGVASYPGAGQNGFYARWGSDVIAQVPFDFSSVTYSDYQQAGQPENMPTLYVSWTEEAGVAVAIALPSQDPVLLFSDAGIGELSNIDPANWSFGFAGRNGGIDVDSLVGDLSVNYEYVPLEGSYEGGPRNMFDDTYSDNERKSFVIEYPPGPEPCFGDLDGDGQINGADLGLMLSAWGACTDDPCLGDLNEDGQVDGADLGLMLGAFGLCP